MHVRNPTCRQKTLDVGKSVSLAQADGQYSPGCSVFLNMALFSCSCGLTRGKEASFDRYTVRISRVSKVGRVRVRVWASVRIRVRFSFGDRVGIRLPDVE